MTLRNTLLGGRRAGTASAFGVGSGQVCWAAAASGGIAALLIAWQPVFTAIRLIGAAYLALLGALALRVALRGARTPSEDWPLATSERLHAGRAYRQGLLSNLANPKMAVFFTSLFPAFAPKHGSTFLALLALGFVFSALTIGWLVLYATVAARIGDLLRRPRVRSAVEGVTGLVLIGLGIRIAAERTPN